MNNKILIELGLIYTFNFSLSIEALRVNPGGNQVDGLPPASSLTITKSHTIKVGNL